MKPIRLIMQAFGSYGKETTIDFTKPNQNLFLITGDTGAGKTTIFDAIVFALYGEASSDTNKKDGAELQSQFAALSLEPFVELTFSEVTGGQEEEYTVRRSPRHVRPARRRGKEKNSVAVAASVSLRMPDGSEYPARETDAKLREIVGLEKSQFMQVAMIAQGEFMQVLRAKSDDKKIIFRRLFGTEIYREIVDELHRRIHEKQKEIGEIRTAFRQEAGHIVVPRQYLEGEEDPDHAAAVEILDSKNRIMHVDRLTRAEMETLTAALDRLCARMEKDAAALGEAGARAEAARDAARDAVTGARNLLKFFDQKEGAQKELKECEARDREIRDARRLATEIDAAWQLEGIFRFYEDAEGQAQKTEHNLKDRQAGLPGLVEAGDSAAREELEARARQEEALQAHAKVRERVDKALDVLAKIQSAEEEVRKRERSCTAAEEKWKTAQDRRQAFDRQEQQWRQEAETLTGAENARSLWQVRAGEAEAIAADLQGLRERERDRDAQRQRAKSRAEAYIKARETYEAHSRTCQAAHAAFLDAQAGFLAREKLRPGRPCPVCGSLDHPHPCALTEEHKDLTREAVEALQQENDQLRLAMEKASAQAGAAAELAGEKDRTCRAEAERICMRLREAAAKEESEMSLWDAQNAAMRDEADAPARTAPGGAQVPTGTAMEAVLSSLPALIGKESDGVPTGTAMEAVLSSLRKRLQKTGEVLHRRASRSGELQKLLRSAETEKQTLQEAVETAERGKNTARLELEKARTALQGLVATRDYVTEQEARDVLAAAERDQKDKTDRYEAVRRRAADAKKAADETAALIERYRRELPGQRAESDRRYDRYVKALADSPLRTGPRQEGTGTDSSLQTGPRQEGTGTDSSLQTGLRQEETGARDPLRTELREKEKLWKQIIGQHRRSEIDLLRRKVQEHGEKKASAGRMLEAARKETAGKERPSLDQLLQKEREAHDRWEAARAVLRDAEEALRTDRAAYEALIPMQEQRGRVIEEHTRLDSLYRNLSGNVSNGRMDIETFVQRYYLERILQAANRRFADMSAGQFELRMIDLDRAGVGKNRGLDLMVYSAVTGREREIRTLSGGESFMAALALALGMADQIRESSASINLDVMFIDEGFGSLDDHARDQAVRVLQRMAGGSRMIGIISHVTELKQEIEDQLIVKKDENGSSVCWQIS